MSSDHGPPCTPWRPFCASCVHLVCTRSFTLRSKIVIVLLMTKVMGVGRLALPNLSRVRNKISFEAWFGRDTLFLYLCAIVMVSSHVLGGGAGRGLLSDVILQLLAIP